MQQLRRLYRFLAWERHAVFLALMRLRLLLKATMEKNNNISKVIHPVRNVPGVMVFNAGVISRKYSENLWIR